MWACVKLLWLWWPISFGEELTSHHWKESDQCHSPIKDYNENKSGREWESCKQSAKDPKSLDQSTKERVEKASEETSAINTLN